MGRLTAEFVWLLKWEGNHVNVISYEKLNSINERKG